MIMHKDVEEILLSHEEIVARCAEMGTKISEDYEGKTPLFIGLLKGAVPFMAELIKHINCKMEIDFIDVSSYSGVESTGKVRIIKGVSVDVTDRHFVFVEDIITPSISNIKEQTLSEVKKIFKVRNAASIEVVTLVDKPEGRKVNDVVPKYNGFNIPNKFVVGFGLDYNELYRNLPYIGVLKRSVYEK